MLSGQCGLVEDAHIVVHALDPGGSSHRDVLAALLQSSPDTPIVIEADLASEDSSATVRRVRFPMTREALLAAVQRDDDI